MLTNLVGTRIRAVRAQKKLTQQHLADLAGVPRATLATVERDDANPSLAVVFKIAKALGIGIDELVEEARQRIQLIPAGEMRIVESADRAYRAVTVSPARSFHITQMVFHLKGHASYEGKPHPPGSEEYLHLLKGEVVLELGGEALHLKGGDSARFHGNIRHFYRNPVESEAHGVVTILEGVASDEKNSAEIS
ncbi:MAG: helix-turn-helix transcriptional regulator [Magnetococcales bacterium]|nr:helix-turn-helix transcriptional regulator [Magnetococcales bacterium]